MANATYEEREVQMKMLRYVGGGRWLMGVPARDLMPGDLAEVEERERIGREQILRSGLYEEVEWVEVAPFCGAPTEEGAELGLGGPRRCQAEVGAWGERCGEHVPSPPAPLPKRARGEKTKRHVGDKPPTIP